MTFFPPEDDTEHQNTWGQFHLLTIRDCLDIEEEWWEEPAGKILAETATGTNVPGEKGQLEHMEHILVVTLSSIASCFALLSSKTQAS